jgi:hypothetical protein
VRFQLSAKLGSDCLARDRCLWYRGALFCGSRNSAGDTLGLGVAVPKNALRAFSNESSAIGSPGLISVFQLLSRPTNTVCSDSTKDMAGMQSDENDGGAQDQSLSNCVQLY